MAGNSNSGRRAETPFAIALKMSVKALEGDRKGFRKVAEKLIEEAENGNMQAIRELADRLDGKSRQAVEHSGDPEYRLVHSIKRIIVSHGEDTNRD